MLARTLALGALLAAPLAAQDFTLIRPGFAPVLSGDGATVAYVDANGGGVRRWRQPSGSVALSPMASGTMDETVGVNFDGTVVVGRRLGPPCEIVWAIEGVPGYGGPWQLAPTGVCSPHAGVADDGTWALSLWNPCGPSCYDLRAGTFTLGATIAPVGDMFQPSLGQAPRCLSRDGLAVGGTDEFAGGLRAAIWKGMTTTFPFVSLADPFGLGAVDALDETGDRAAVTRFDQTWYWERGVGLTEIFPLPGFTRFTPTAMSADGALIVGTAFGPNGSKGHVWQRSEGVLVRAAEWFALRGLSIPPGQPIDTLDGISKDGKFVCGTSGPTVFWAELPGWTKYYALPTPVNNLQLVGAGLTSIGSTFGAQTIGTPGVFTVTVLSRARKITPLFGGQLVVDLDLALHPFDISPIPIFFSDAQYAIPLDQGLVGLRFYLQSARPNPALPPGWSLSNGLEVLLCD